MSVDPEAMRSAALVVSAALRDDDTSVRLILHTLPPRSAAAVAEASVLAMAELVREAITPEALQNAVREAQQLAHTAAQEGTQA